MYDAVSFVLLFTDTLSTSVFIFIFYISSLFSFSFRTVDEAS